MGDSTTPTVQAAAIATAAASISVPRAEPVAVAPGQATATALPQLLSQGILSANISHLMQGQKFQGMPTAAASLQFDPKRLANVTARGATDALYGMANGFGKPELKPSLLQARKASAQVKRSCINCKLAKTRCDNQRPCRRCLRTGREATCVDSVHKKRGRKRSNAATSGGKSQSDDRSRVDMFTKRAKASPAPAPPLLSGVVKDTLTYVETLLTVCNQQLERWNNMLRQANALPQPLSTDMQHCKNSLKAYQWIAACMLKNLQDVVKVDNGDGSTAAAKEAIRAAARKAEAEAKKVDPNKIDPREVFFGTLPVGVAVFSLQPSPFAPGNKPWVNKRLAELLGYTPAELAEKMSSLKGISSLYHIVNLQVTIQLFMEALSRRRENYEVQTKWINRRGEYLDMLETVSVKYDATGVPVSVTVIFQKMSENKVA